MYERAEPLHEMKWQKIWNCRNINKIMTTVRWRHRVIPKSMFWFYFQIFFPLRRFSLYWYLRRFLPIFNESFKFLQGDIYSPIDWIFITVGWRDTKIWLFNFYKSQNCYANIRWSWYTSRTNLFSTVVFFLCNLHCMMQRG